MPKVGNIRVHGFRLLIPKHSHVSWLQKPGEEPSGGCVTNVSQVSLSTCEHFEQLGARFQEKLAQVTIANCIDQQWEYSIFGTTR